MNKLFFTFLGAILSIFQFSFSEVPTVIVSVAPHQFFVEKIAGETVQIYLMVPAGASAHTYEPTPRQMMQAGKADIWFNIGESFEDRAIQALISHRPSLQLVNLQQNLDLIRYSSDHCHCCKGSEDLHFWLSLRLAAIQAETIAGALSRAYPAHQEFYQTRLKLFQTELSDLDKKISALLSRLTNRNLVVGHPAYAYFCRDYGLVQYSIEIEGKDPTPKQMTQLLQFMRKTQVSTIFVQPQYNNKAARLVADEIGAHLVTLNPYSADYLTSMLSIAEAIANPAACL